MSSQPAALGPRDRFAAMPREAFLRFALKIDAVISAANALAYLVAADALDSVLGVEAGVLRPVGAFFVLYAAAVWFAATRPKVSDRAVRVVVAANVVWVLASLVVLVAGTLSPTTIGAVWVAIQAAVVGGFAALQLTALRRDA